MQPEFTVIFWLALWAFFSGCVGVIVMKLYDLLKVLAELRVVRKKSD